jgi:hypothetical protein
MWRCSAHRRRSRRSETPSAAQISVAFRLALDQALKADHDVPTSLRRPGACVPRTRRQTFDHNLDQLLLQTVRGFGFDKGLRANSGHPDGCRMEAAELPARRRRRSPTLCGGWERERGAGQRAAVSHQFPGRKPNRAPAAGPVGPHVHLLATGEDHDLSRVRPDPAADRHRSLADRKRCYHHVGRHRDEGDARQLLLCRR